MGGESRTKRCSRPGGHNGFSRRNVSPSRPAAELCRSAKEALAVDAATRKRLIFEKANANAQRREREKFLEVLASEMRAFLADVECIFTPESDEVLRRFLPATAAGIGTPSRPAPSGYSFREFAWDTKVFASLHYYESIRETRAYLAVRPPHVVFFENEGFYVPELPVFVVSFRAAACMLKELWSIARRFIALVSVDLSAGIVIDSYIGYLPEDLNASEIVYEIASW
jgi:hypothetical protein